jgi:sugar phosphate isomerase/epimerase
MKIAITAARDAGSQAPILFSGGMGDAFALAAELGYDGVEIHLQHPQEIDRNAVGELARRHGLGVPTLGTGMAAGREGLVFSDSDPAIRAQAVQRIRSQIDLASFLHAGVTIGLIYGRLGSDPAKKEEKREAAVECLKECCRHAEHRGVTLFLEAINRYEMDQLVTLDEAIECLHQVGSGSLKLLADTFHMNIEEVDLPETLRRAAGLLGHVHLSDSNRQVPGHGHLDMKAVLGALRDIRFEGYLSFEVFPLPDPVSAARDGIAHVRHLLAAR